MSQPLPIAGVIAKKFTDVVGTLSIAVFAATTAFTLVGMRRGRRDPAKHAVRPGLIYGLSLGALVLAADAVWG
jgi:hypothetical protein